MPRRAILIVGALIILLAIVLITWQFFARSGSTIQSEPYLETFDSIGTWTTGEDISAVGIVAGGVYEMSLEQSGDIFWVTAGQTFADGEYEVEITPLEGTQDNGYGMLFRVNEEDDSFYIFKISSDGFVYIGHCADSCLEQKPLVGQDWFASPSVKQGFDVTNRLRAVVSGSEMIFYVNGEEVGQTSNDALGQGDIGLMAETFTPGGLRVTFYNFTVLPLVDE